MNTPAQQLSIALAPHGFRLLRHRRDAICAAIWKRQTINSNRAVALVEVSSLPTDPSPLLKAIKKEAAFRCRFFPFFYGLGTQVVLWVTGEQPTETKLQPYVDKFDNQWSIIQSIFLIHDNVGLISSARTWGQLLTSKYQDAIAAALCRPDDASKSAGQAVQTSGVPPVLDL